MELNKKKFSTHMAKKDVKESLKQFHKVAEDNSTDLKTLDILNPSIPDHESIDHSQEYIQRNVNLYTREKAFSLALDNGPFKCRYTQNGSHMLVHNSSGYFSAFNAQSFDMCFEIDLEDPIYDARYLHNELYLATAQKDCVFIYDSTGRELHAVRDMKSPKMLEFLPYHFLLAGVSDNGFMDYLDTSTGEVVSSLFVGTKNPTAIKNNPSSAVVHLGSRRGQVSLWAPSQKSSLMTVNCHTSAVSAIEIDRTGDHMITAGIDNKVKVFDIRNTYKPLKTIPTKTNVHFTALSQRNILAMGYSNKVAMLKDFDRVYMKHSVSGPISSLEFCNHEDVLGIGHIGGISSIVVPGSGDPVYDSGEVPPFMTKKERQNLEVKKLLDKIPADMISMEPVLGKIGVSSKTMPRPKRYFEAGENETRTALSRFSRKNK